MHLSPALKTVLADISLVFAALFWGLGFVAMKDALDAFPTFWLLSLRFGSAALLMGIIFRRRLVAITKEDIRAGTIIGIFLFLGFATQTIGLNYTTPGKQAFLTATYVVIVPFLSWGLRRIFPGAFSFVASFVCLVGMGLLTLQKGTSIGKGDALTLICAFFFACHLIAIEYFAAKKDPMVLAMLQILMVSLLSLPAAFVSEQWPGFQTGSGLWSLAYTVVFATIISLAVQNTAQKFTPSTHTAILLSLESVFGALSGIYFLGEIFTPRMAAGCALIFVAVLLTEAGPSLVRSVSLRVAAAREKA